MARKSRKTAASVAAVSAAPAAKVWSCAVYARLSCRNNGQAGDGSLRAQVDFVRDSLSGMEGVEVVGVYEDNGRTGTTFEGRAAFDALMDEVRAGAVDCIAVKDLSRFGRNMYETSTYLERIFPFLGVRFIAGSTRCRATAASSCPSRGWSTRCTRWRRPARCRR